MRKADERREGRARLLTPTFLLLTLSTFLYFVTVGSLVPVLPRYVEGPLGSGSVAVGLAMGAFSLTAVLFRPLAGRLGDVRGRAILIVLGGGAVAASVAGYWLATSLWVLVLMRLLTGAGEAAFYVGVASAVNDLAPDERRGEAVSFFSLALFAGLAAGPVMGEHLLEAYGYGAVWAASSIFAALAASIGLRVPDTRTALPDRRRRLLHPAGLFPGLVLGAQVWGLGGFNTFVPLYALSIGLGGSRMVFVLFSAIILAIRGFWARLPDVVGRRRSARLALTFNALGLALIGLWPSAAGLYVGAALFAFGQAFGFPALMSLTIDAARPSERASAVGTFTMFFDLAFGLGAVSLGAIAAAIGYRGLFLSAAGIALLGLALLFLKRDRYETIARDEAASVAA